MKKIHYSWLDFLKACAILAVIIDHNFLILYHNHTIQGYVYFSVTVFTFLAGITQALSLSRRKTAGWVYWKARFTAILIPYAIATLFYHVLHTGGLIDLPLLARQLLTFSASPPFYFLVFYLQLALVSPLIFRGLARANHPVRLLILLGIAALSLALNRFTAVPGVYGGGGKLLGGSYLLVFSLGMWLYFYLGSLLHFRVALALLIPAALGLAGFIRGGLIQAAFSNPPNAYLMLYSLLVTAFLFSFWMVFVEKIPLFVRLAKPLLLVGRYSLHIFLFHLFFMGIAARIAAQTGLDGNIWILRVWTLAFAAGASAALGWLIERLVAAVPSWRIEHGVDWLNRQFARLGSNPKRVPEQGQAQVQVAESQPEGTPVVESSAEEARPQPGAVS